MDPRDLTSADYLTLLTFQKADYQYQTAVMAHSFGFGISMMAVIAAFSVLFHPNTLKGVQQREQMAFYVFLGYALALLGLSMAYYAPIAASQTNFSSRVLGAAYELLTRGSTSPSAYLYWTPPGGAFVLFSITLWFADGVLGYLLWAAWKGNLIIAALFGLWFVALIVTDFVAYPISGALAVTYDFLILGLLVFRYLKQRKTKTDAVSDRGHVRVAPSLAIIIGVGLFCMFRTVWVASLFALGGSNIWGNAIMFAAAVAIQCVGIAALAGDCVTAVDDNASDSDATVHAFGPSDVEKK